MRVLIKKFPYMLQSSHGQDVNRSTWSSQSNSFGQPSLLKYYITKDPNKRTLSLLSERSKRAVNDSPAYITLNHSYAGLHVFS